MPRNRPSTWTLRSVRAAQITVLAALALACRSDRPGVTTSPAAAPGRSPAPSPARSPDIQEPADRGAPGREDPPPADRGGPRGDPEAGRLAGITAAHNRVRERVGVPPLEWSPELARYAQRWADKLKQRGCRLDHRPGSGPDAQRHGENLFSQQRLRAHRGRGGRIVGRRGGPLRREAEPLQGHMWALYADRVAQQPAPRLRHGGLRRHRGLGLQLRPARQLRRQATLLMRARCLLLARSGHRRLDQRRQHDRRGDRADGESDESDVQLDDVADERVDGVDHDGLDDDGGIDDDGVDDDGDDAVDDDGVDDDGVDR
jgi:hypothetical protein